MKILHTIETSGPGGAENFMIRMAQSLGPEYQSSILLIKPGWLRDRIESLGIPVCVEELPRSLDPRWLIKIARFLRKERIEAVHSHEFAMNIHMAILAKILGLPHVATVHGKKNYADRGLRRLVYRVISHWSHIVAVSEDVKNFLVDTVGISAEKVEVIPNGIDVDDYKLEQSEIDSCRAGLGCREGDFLICAVGNLYPIKGHSFLVEAMHSIVATQPTAKLVIAGRGDEQQHLQQLIDSLGITDNVKLLGFRDDVKSILSSSDLFVMPSLSEGLPLALLEAMASRVPVVVTDVGGMPQVIEHQRTGLVVPPSDSAGLRNSIATMMSDQAVANAMADAAYRELGVSYSMVTMLRRYASLYRA